MPSCASWDAASPSIGVDYGQGYAIARPQLFNASTKLLKPGARPATDGGPGSVAEHKMRMAG